MPSCTPSPVTSVFSPSVRPARTSIDFTPSPSFTHTFAGRHCRGAPLGRLLGPPLRPCQRRPPPPLAAPPPPVPRPPPPSALPESAVARPPPPPPPPSPP